MKALLWLITCLLCGVWITQPIADPDLFWHLNIGNWITSHGMLPASDLWVSEGGAHIFRAYSWLFECVLSWTYKIGGFKGVIISEVILGTGLVTLFSYVFSKLSKNYFSGILLGMFGAGAVVAHFSFRPQTFTWGLFVLVLYICNRSCAFSVRQKYLSLFFIMALWANLHISTVLGLFAVLFLFEGSKNQKIFASVSSFLGTFFTPYLGGEWLTFIEKVSHPADFSIIDEFKAARFIDVPSILLILSLSLLLAIIIEKRRLISKEKILVGILLIGLGVTVVKFIPFACLYVLFLTSENMDNSTGVFSEGFSRLYLLFEKYLSGQGLAVVLLALMYLKLTPLMETPIQKNIFPEEEMNFFKEKNLPLPLLSGFNEGGYVSFMNSNSKGEPNFRVTMDGRTNLISKELWSDFVSALKGDRDYFKLVERTNPQTVLWKSDSAFVQLLKKNGFCEVMNKKYSVLVREEVAKALNFSEKCIP